MDCLEHEPDDTIIAEIGSMSGARCFWEHDQLLTQYWMFEQGSFDWILLWRLCAVPTNVHMRVG